MILPLALLLQLVPLAAASGSSPVGVSVVSSTLKQQFSLFIKYAVTGYCQNIVTQNSFSCGTRCTLPEVQGTKVEAIVSNSTSVYHAYALVNPNIQSIIMVYKGSVATENYIADGQMRLVTPTGFTFPSSVVSPKVHNGFLLSYTSIRDSILLAAKNAAAKYPTYKIVFTGHSLGASVAQLAAVHFYQAVPSAAFRISLYTYGQPRVGNQAWARYVNTLPFASRMYRLAGEKDSIVNSIPTQFGYEHSFQQYLVKNDGTTWTCANDSPTTGETQPCLLNPTFGSLNGHILYYGSLASSTCT